MLIYVLAGVVVAGVLLALWVRSRMRRSDEAFARKIREHGLEEFNRRLTDEVIRRVRPMDHLSLTRMMVEILDQLAEARPGESEAAVVEPPDEGYRLACDELVSLGKLERHQHVYTRRNGTTKTAVGR